jgi:hypothetical protein
MKKKQAVDDEPSFQPGGETDSVAFCMTLERDSLPFD